MSRIVRALLLTMVAVVCSAHIGSPDAWFSGPAGPYQVLVHVRVPPVVPGIAVISIKPAEAVDSITAFVNKFDAVAGAPPPDVAKRGANNPEWFRTDLWVMDPGSNSVTVAVYGSRGAGNVVVPLVAVASRRLQFEGTRRLILIVLGALLVAGLLSVIGAAVRESVLPAGEVPDSNRLKRARLAMIKGAVAVVVVAAALGYWWRAEDSYFDEGLYRPLTATARTEISSDSGTQLVLTISDSAWSRRNDRRRVGPRGGEEFTELVEDHGKLMHLFVIAEGGGGAFAHLHPATTDSVSFYTSLPPLPPGSYRVFADIVHATGMTQTLATGVVIQSAMKMAGYAAQADDGWIADVADNANGVVTLPDGTNIEWLGANEPHVAGELASLQFRVTPPAGDTAGIEPYLGMQGHAVVVRDDGAVFIHLHPMGTVSAAAQRLLSRTGNNEHSAMMAHMNDGMLEFPYAFPAAGNFTVWLQVKRHGRVQTAAFRASIKAP